MSDTISGDWYRFDLHIGQKPKIWNMFNNFNVMCIIDYTVCLDLY